MSMHNMLRSKKKQMIKAREKAETSVYFLLCQKTFVQFLAPRSGSSHYPITPAPGESEPLASKGTHPQGYIPPTDPRACAYLKIISLFKPTTGALNYTKHDDIEAKV